jgi:hypothetical protein
LSSRYAYIRRIIVAAVTFSLFGLQLQQVSYGVDERKKFNAAQASLRISDTEPSTAKDKNRLYCMVPFLWAPKYLPSYAAIRNTWGKRCDVLKFFIDPIIEYSNGNFVDLRHRNGANVVLPEDVVVLYDVHRPWHVCASTKDGNCRNIWEKVWRSWLWIDNNGDSDLAEWFVKVDSDTYLFPENAKKYVEEKNWLPDEHHYFGHKLRHAEIPIIAGASVFLSRATVKGAAAIFREFIPKPQKTSGRKCMDAHSTAEEVYTALCLKQYLGIVAEHSLGELGDELIIVSEIEDSLLWNRTQQGEWWYWKNKPKTDPKTGREIHYCCGDSPIAFHGYKDPLWFYKLENEFYEMDELPGVSDKWKEYKWRNSNETNSYFDRVRKAMNARV